MDETEECLACAKAGEWSDASDDAIVWATTDDWNRSNIKSSTDDATREQYSPVRSDRNLPYPHMPYPHIKYWWDSSQTEACSFTISINHRRPIP